MKKERPFQPMLAPSEIIDLGLLTYPLYGSPKIDGIRCVCIDGQVYSRKLKLLPNKSVQQMFGEYAYLDGELILGEPTAHDVFRKTESFVMAEAPVSEDVKFYVFDNFLDPKQGYIDRLCDAREYVEAMDNPKLIMLESVLLSDAEEAREQLNSYLEQGYEGMMLRHPLGTYKYGRATIREGTFFKQKIFEDAEGRLVAVDEGFENHNVQETDERGYAKRSTVSENLIPSGMAGALIVEFEGQLVSVAPGKFTHEERRDILVNFEKYQGHLVKFKFSRHGVKDAPRFARAMGFRSNIDV